MGVLIFFFVAQPLLILGLICRIFFLPQNELRKNADKE